MPDTDQQREADHRRQHRTGQCLQPLAETPIAFGLDLGLLDLFHLLFHHGHACFAPGFVAPARHPDGLDFDAGAGPACDHCCSHVPILRIRP
ncbi:hypothetical protein SDC9_134093 [bioreactor metagenome]|uniref:Uncharacterized protein n=1 Tax=bioreactor metagenome TaxID=1076179 RepID=A0A645DBZ2_9ZZZZ